MKLAEPINANYAAQVVALPELLKLPNSDFLLGAPLLGYQAIVDHTHKAGEIGIVFTAETRLSEEFASKNNLFRHADKNVDQSVTGYLEDNRRVRAVKLRGNNSSALWLPLSTLEYAGVGPGDLKVGDTFDKIGKFDICEKHVAKQPKVPGQRTTPVKSRVDELMFPLHFDTSNYFRNQSQVSEERFVVITQKTHGTSVRIGNTLVERKLSIFERILKRLGVKVQETEYAMVYGSRTVTKDANRPAFSKHFDNDIWTIVGKRLDGVLPENWIAFGEIIGWSGEKEIQKDYAYELPQGEAKLLIYRIAVVNPRGRTVDLGWEQVKQFCQEAGVDHVAELWSGWHGNFRAEEWVDVRYADETLPSGRRRYPTAEKLKTSTKKNPIVDEGVCIRAEGLTPLILKAKSPIFLGYETKQLDNDVVDLETAEATIESDEEAVTVA